MVRISAPHFPAARTMKVRPNRRSYSLLPSASAILTSSLEEAASSGSCADHAADCGLADDGAFDSPIRGWLRKASSQSSSAKPRQISSDTDNRASSLSTGLRLAMAFAQAEEPQQGSISLRAASVDNEFHRARVIDDAPLVLSF